MRPFRQVLDSLAQLDKSDFNTSLKQILRANAECLGVDRVGFWRMTSDRAAIVCERLVQVSTGEISSGTRLEASVFPGYFAALRECRSIMAHDAWTDPRTCEFADAYFRPNGITSMLDVPVWHAGKLFGVVCHEHVGPRRQWTADEHDFAVSVADLIAVALEARRRRSAEERQELFARVSEDIFWEWDIATSRLDWSDGAAAAMRYRAEELTTNFDWWSERVHPEDLQRTKASLEQVLTTGDTSWSDEYRFRLGDGSWAIFQDRAFLIRDENGNPIRMLGAISDVTEHRLLQEKLQISDRMACVGTLAAGVAHEINNPLAFIKSNLEFVLAELKDSTGLPPDVADALRDALEGADRVRQIVAGMKAFSRGDEELRPIALEPVIELSLRMTHNEVRHCAALVKELGNTPKVMGNESKLGQVVLNLLVNAAQAMRGGRSDQHLLWLRTYTSAGGDAVLEVEDTGPGIPRDLRRRVFDPFFTTKAIGDGTGLGLSICHGLVTGMSGEMTIEDGARGGCLMRVTLPAAPAEAFAPESRSRVEAGLRLAS